MPNGKPWFAETRLAGRALRSRGCAVGAQPLGRGLEHSFLAHLTLTSRLSLRKMPAELTRTQQTPVCEFLTPSARRASRAPRLCSESGSHYLAARRPSWKERKTKNCPPHRAGPDPRHVPPHRGALGALACPARGASSGPQPGAGEEAGPLAPPAPHSLSRVSRKLVVLRPTRKPPRLLGPPLLCQDGLLVGPPPPSVPPQRCPTHTASFCSVIGHRASP